MDNANSSSDFIDRVNAVDESAIAEIDRRYRTRLCSLVERELGRRFAPREDPEDAVQSAMRSLFRGLKGGRFHIDHSGALWRLLATLVHRKVQKHVEHHAAAKRSPAREAPLNDAPRDREPSAEEVACAAELLSAVSDRLSEDDAEIFQLKLQDFSNAEIALETGLTQAQVRYRVEQIRETLFDLSGDAPQKGVAARE